MEIGCADFGTPYFYLDNLFLILNMFTYSVNFRGDFSQILHSSGINMCPGYRNTLFFIKKCK